VFPTQAREVISLRGDKEPNASQSIGNALAGKNTHRILIFNGSNPMNKLMQSNQINLILTKCWAGASFKQKLLVDPSTVLKAEGVDIPEGYTVRILENTDKVLHFVIPEHSTELPDDLLEKLAGGANNKEVSVRNSLTKGAINAGVFKDGKLL
jgi:hypothetical protein